MVTASELLQLADRLATLAADMGIEGTASGQSLTHVADFLEEAAGQQAIIDMRRERCADYRLPPPVVDISDLAGDGDVFVWGGDFR